MNTKEKQKQEAIKRMKALKLMKNVIDDFDKKGKVYYSERQNKIFDGILYWLDNEQKYVDLVKDFEQKFNAVVYHCQLTHTAFGDLLSMLYVSSHENEWESDFAMLKEGETYANVVNLTDGDMSEIGMIGIAPRNGGVARTY